MQKQQTRRTILRIFAASLFLGTGLSRGYALEKKNKILIIYYSRTNQNAQIANTIHQTLNCDIVRIEPVTPYPESYDQTVLQVINENNHDYSPPLKSNIPDLSQYDTILLGTPVWASGLSLPIKTFLKTHDLSGKIILPFVTYIVSQQGGNCVDQIKTLAPNAHVLPLLAVLGESAKHATPSVKTWLDKNNATLSIDIEQLKTL